jgi:hypothetical protein
MLFLWVFCKSEVFKLAFATLYWAAKKFRVGREVIKEINGKWATNNFFIFVLKEKIGT